MLLVGARGGAARGRRAELGDGADYVAADITDPDADERIVATCAEQMGGIDVLVNNAGTSFVAPARRADRRRLARAVRAPRPRARCGSCARPRRGWPRAAAGGSSTSPPVAGKRPSLTNAAYSVTQGRAALALARLRRRVGAPRRARQRRRRPGRWRRRCGPAPGGMADQIGRRARASSREEALQAQRDKVPLGRFAEPGEIADVIVFLCWRGPAPSPARPGRSTAAPSRPSSERSAHGAADWTSAAMPVSTAAVGKSYPPVTYAVGREKIREYARAVGETNPLHLDVEAARAAGLRRRRGAADVRGRLQRARRRPGAASTPRSASTSRAWSTAARSSAWGRPVVAGDEITTDRDGQGHLRARRRRASTSSSRSRPTRTARPSASGPGRTSCGGSERWPTAGERDPELKVTPDRYLTVRYAGASGDFNPIHIDEEFARRSGCPGGSCTACGRWPRSRGRRPRRAAARQLRRLWCSSAAWACPSRRSRSPAPCARCGDGTRGRRHRRRAGRQADHPQRRGRAAPSTDGSGRRALRYNPAMLTPAPGADPAQGRRGLPRDRPARGLEDARRRPRLDCGPVDGPQRAGACSRSRACSRTRTPRPAACRPTPATATTSTGCSPGARAGRAGARSSSR